MQKSDAARIIAGLTPAETKQSSAPTSVHVMSGEVVGNSESGKVQIRMDGDVVSPNDDQIIEIDALGGLEEGDTATILLTGQPGRAMTPMVMGSSGSVDRIVERIKTIEADYIKATEIEAEVGKFGYLKASELETEVGKFGYLKANQLEAEVATFGYLKADDLEAEVAEFGYLKADSATITNLQADTAKIHNLSANDISAATGYIHDLTSSNVTAQNIIADHGDFSTVKANAAKVANLTAQELEADHATIANLDSSYAQIDMANVNNAWIANGLIKDAAIKSEMVESISANQLTAGEIDADEITVRNLRASSLTVQTADGYIYVGEKRIPTKEFIDSLKDELQNEIDGAIETFTVSAVPTLNNTPANEWVVSGDAEATRKLRAKHVGDIAYVVNSSSAQNGYCYRFAYDATAQEFKWVLIKDSDVTAALSRLTTAEGKITGLETFESNTTSWMNETDDGLETIRTNHTNLSGRVDKTVVETKQLWFTKSNTTAPDKPTAAVTSTSTAGNAWRVVVPAWNASYPNYYYCLQYKLADGTYAWSDVVRDIAMGESQQQGRKGVADAATADGKAVSAQNTANANIKSSVQLWFTKANNTAPTKPSAQVTTNSASTTNAWNLAIPTYNSSYPHYFTCYQQQKGDGTYQWSDVVYDRSVTEAQAKAQAALPSSTFTTFQSTTFKNLVDEVGEQSSTITTISERVDKIQVGGRNRLINTANPSASNPVKGANCGNPNINRGVITYEDGVGTFTINSGTEEVYARFVPTAGNTLSLMGLPTNGSFVFSGYAKTSFVNGNGILNVRAQYYDGVWRNCESMKNLVSGAGGVTAFIKVVSGNVSEWTYFAVSMVIPEDVTTTGFYVSLQAYDSNVTNNVAAGGVFQFKNLKFEKGDRATDWSPAPEDVEASVKTVSTTVNSVKQTAYSNSTYLTNLTTTLGTNADGTSKSEDIVHKYNTLNQTLDGTVTRVGTTEAKLETVSNPNLSPFFSMDLDNGYNSEKMGTDGYWQGNNSSACTKLSDGWVHYKRTNSGTSTTWLTIYEHSAWRHAHGDLKGDTTYTVLMEFRNVTKSGNVTAAGITQHATSWPSMFASSAASQAIEEGVSLYFTAKTVADPASVTGNTCTTRTLIAIPAGASIECDLRVSLYEGAYTGPYKPYVDQTLAERVTQAETDIEQNTTDITLRATKTEAYQSAQPNLSPFFSMDFADVYNASTNPKGYWYQTHAGLHLTGFTPLADGWAHFEYTNSTSSAYFPKFCVASSATPYTLKPSTKYTFLLELRNWSAGDSRTWIGLATDNSVFTDVFAGSITRAIGTTAQPEYRIYATTETDITGKSLFNYGEICVYAGDTVSCDIRISIYEGEYDGPYKPYSGKQLYSTQAELKVANDSISSKVSKTDYNGQIVASLINQSADSVKIKANHVIVDGTTTFGTSSTLSDYVDGVADSIEVGGRNLLKCSKASSDNLAKTLSSSASYTSLVTEDGYACYKVTGASTYGMFYGTNKSATDVAVALEADTTYIYSAWIKVTTTASGVTYLDHHFTSLGHHQVYNTASTASDKSHEDVAAKRVYLPERINVGEWTHITEQFTTNSLAGSYFGKYVKHNLGDAYTVYVRDMKLEKGNKATDWTPAPEDQIAYVDSLTIGGRNLLLWTGSLKKGTNTTVNGKDGITSWGGALSLLTETDDGIKMAASNHAQECFAIPLANNGSVGNGEKVLLTFEARGNITSVGQFYWIQASGSNIAMMSWLNGSSTISLSETNWTKFTVDVSNNSANVRTCTKILLFYALGSANNGKWVELRKKSIKLEKGDRATDWSPAPEETISRTQRIYYRKSSTGTPSAPSAWVTTGNNGTNYYNQWTTKVPPIASGTGANVDKYAYLYTCEQRQMVDGTLDHTTILLDDSTTVIDGGKIITGSLQANAVSATSGTFDAANIPALTADHIKANVISAVNNGSGKINADKINVSQISIGSLSGSIGGRNLLLGTGDWSTCAKSATGTYAIDGTKNGCTVLRVTTTSTTSTDTAFNSKFTSDIEADAYYTLSFWAKASTAVNCWCFWYSPNAINSAVNQDGATSTRDDGGIQNAITTSWKRYYVTWHIKSDATSFPTRVIPVRLQTAATVWIAGCKFEKGNRATDWTPAPEDQTAYVDSIQVGGRNYILDSAGVNVSGIGGGSRYEWRHVNLHQSYMDIPHGTSVTISFDLYMTVNTANPTLLVYNTNDKGPKAFSQVADGTGSSSGVTISLTASAGTVIDKRVSVTGYINDRSSPMLSENWLEFYSTYGTSNWYSISNLKLEIGNKATDWTPAPEDVSQMVKIDLASRSFTTAQWKTYGAVGHSENWTTGTSYDNSKIRVGDTAYLTGTVSDGVKGTATIIGTVTAVNGVGGSTSITMSSTQLIFGGDSVDAAAKTATNYIVANSSGIKIANASPSSATTYQLQTASGTDFVVAGAVRNRINGNGMTLYDGNGVADSNIVAKFAANLVELGKGSTDAVIKFCNGMGDISYNADTKFLNLNSLRLSNYAKSNGTDMAASQIAAHFDTNAGENFANVIAEANSGYTRVLMSATRPVSGGDQMQAGIESYATGTEGHITFYANSFIFSGPGISGGGQAIKAIYAGSTVVNLSNGKWLSLADPTVVAQKLGSGASQGNTICIAQNGGHESYTGVVTGAMGSDGSARAYIYPNHTGYIRINFILIRFA